MAIMPLDPKLAKIVIEGHRQKALKEIVSIVSFLSVQVPRERPLNFQQKADEKHSVDKDKSSDFIAILNLANRLNSDLKGLSNREKKDYFKRNFISSVRFNEWNDIYRQIVEVIHGFGWRLHNKNSCHSELTSTPLSTSDLESLNCGDSNKILNQVQDDTQILTNISNTKINRHSYEGGNLIANGQNLKDTSLHGHDKGITKLPRQSATATPSYQRGIDNVNYENLHKAIASGFLSNIGFNYENAEYLGARGLKFFIFPGSSQFKKKPKWLLSSEIVETTKTYARNVAKIEPEWLETLANHLIKKHYDEPIWSKKRRSVVVNERVTLYGLEIISKRSVQYSKINPQEAREIFIREALVNGDFESNAYFYQQNLKLIEQVEDLENKSRRKDILVDEQVMYEHYDKLIPEDVCSGVTFDKWLKTISKDEQKKFVFDLDSLMQHDAKDVTQQKFPDVLSVGEMHLPLEYHFDPLDEKDGATVTVPIVFLNDINPNVLEWGLYGFLYDKIVALLRALPKNIRKNCVPVPTYAEAIFESVDFDADRYKSLKSVIAKHITRIVGSIVDETVWQGEELEKHLILNIKVVDENGKTLAIDKDVNTLKQKLKDLVQKPKQTIDDKVYYDWEFNDFEYTSQIKEYGINVKVYNCLELHKDGVRVSYKATEQEAKSCMQKALKKLIKLRLQSRLSKNIKSNDLASLSISLKLSNSKDNIVDKAIDLSFLNIGDQAQKEVIPDYDPESLKYSRETLCLDSAQQPIQDDSRKVIGGLPYTKEAFERLYMIGLKQFDSNKSKVVSLVSEIVKYKNELEKKLNIRKIPFNFIQLYTDIKGELTELFINDYLSQPIKFLQRYKYYIQALENRLEKAKLNLQRDKAYQIGVDELRSKLDKKIKAKHLNSESSEIIKINFLIKELWVSWYLQNIKTIESVSYKKILTCINGI